MEQKYESVIGLEIHVQLKTKSKMFCACDNTGEDQPINTTICPVCTGQPGVLPVPNQQAIDWGIMAALALDCRIPERSKFDRKSYFYPDLPKGYQISQFDEPVGLGGHLIVRAGEHPQRVGITRLHLEEDAAKLLHPDGKNYSLVDFNRAGTPLIEIVTEPDIRTPAEARTFLQELRLTMRYLAVSDADMEKGHLRCDANISVRPVGETKLYPKTEVKNLNSFRAVERALTYEAARQRELWAAGTPDALQSTRSWDEKNGETILQRTKEGASDYRYFPEPDIPPMRFSQNEIERFRAMIPELPPARRARFSDELHLQEKDIDLLVNDKALGDFAEETISEIKAWCTTEGRSWEKEGSALTQQMANWLINRLQTLLVAAKLSISESKVTAENFAEFTLLVAGGKMNNQVAQKVLEEMFSTGADPSDIIEAEGLAQIDDEEQLARAVRQVIEEHAKVADEYKSGKEAALKFLIGKVMAATKGKANPQTVQKLLKEELTK